jgi:hypothetical protein
MSILSTIADLPPELTYLIFLGVLAVDAVAAPFTTGSFNILSTITGSVGNGAIGTAVGFLVYTAFGLSVSISSFQLLIVFTLLPICWWLVNH